MDLPLRDQEIQSPKITYEGQIISANSARKLPVNDHPYMNVDDLSSPTKHTNEQEGSNLAMEAVAGQNFEPLVPSSVPIMRDITPESEAHHMQTDLLAPWEPELTKNVAANAQPKISAQQIAIESQASIALDQSLETKPGVLTNFSSEHPEKPPREQPTSQINALPYSVSQVLIDADPRLVSGQSTLPATAETLRNAQSLGSLLPTSPTSSRTGESILQSSLSTRMEQIPETQTTASSSMLATKPTVAQEITPFRNPPINSLGASSFESLEMPLEPQAGEHNSAPDTALGLQSQGPVQPTAHAPTASNPTIQTTSLSNLAQVVDANVSLRDNAGKIDVALKPEDLGRLAIKFEQTANGTQIIFSAERPETQDLMRRQMDFLHQQFKNLGHENLTFAFTSSQDQTHSQEGDATHTETLPPEETEILLSVKQSVSNGLDIRI